MASVKKIGKSWVAQIRKRGVRKSASFSTKKEAVEWSIKIEAEIISGDRGDIPDKPFGALLQRYAEEVSVNKKGVRWERIRIAMFKRDPIALVGLPVLNSTHVAEWRDRRLSQVSKDSVRREWSLMSHACTIAKKEWRWLKVNPFTDVRKPAKSEPRSRRPTTEEIEAILYTLGYEHDSPPDTVTSRVGAMWLFAMETAIRAGEITKMTWDNVYMDQKYVHLPKTITKTGFARDVPLSAEARRILEQVRGYDEKLCFLVNSAQQDVLFRRGRKKAGVEDLHFHDSRREALTRLAKKVDVMNLAKISGHRDLTILQNTYYNPTIQDLVDLVD